MSSISEFKEYMKNDFSGSYDYYITCRGADPFPELSNPPRKIPYSKKQLKILKSIHNNFIKGKFTGNRVSTSDIDVILKREGKYDEFKEISQIEISSLRDGTSPRKLSGTIDVSIPGESSFGINVTLTPQDQKLNEVLKNVKSLNLSESEKEKLIANNIEENLLTKTESVTAETKRLTQPLSGGAAAKSDGEMQSSLAVEASSSVAEAVEAALNRNKQTQQKRQKRSVREYKKFVLKKLPPRTNVSQFSIENMRYIIVDPGNEPVWKFENKDIKVTDDTVSLIGFRDFSICNNVIPREIYNNIESTCNYFIIDTRTNTISVSQKFDAGPPICIYIDGHAAHYLDPKPI